MSENFHVIKFPLKKDLPAQKIEFVPHGTRTLKILVTNPDPEKITGKYVLRSRNVPDEFPKTKFFSHEKGGANFRVSWGGGYETGVCLNGVDKQIAGKKIPVRECVELVEPSYIYINVTHVSGPVDQSYTLELGIYPVKNSKNSKRKYSLDIILEPPKQIAAKEITDPIHLDHSSKHEFTFTGSDVPDYIDRWWSSPVVNYSKPANDIPELKLVADDNRLEIKLKDGVKFETIAHVQDNVRFQDVIDKARYFDAELYHFHEQYFVLRLWFAWLEKHLSTKFSDEFPDAERFDLLIDSKKRRVVYAATDYHWREVWVPVPRPKRHRYLIAHLGMFSNELLKLIGDKLPLLGSKVDSWLEWATDAIHEAEKEEAKSGDSKPRIPSVQVYRAVKGEIKAEHLGANVEAHVPSFENVSKPEGIGFISSDPQKG